MEEIFSFNTHDSLLSSFGEGLRGCYLYGIWIVNLYLLLRLVSVEALEVPVLVEELVATPSRFRQFCERTHE